nr:dna-binding protein smubp-2 [Quercus suber]
MYLTSFCDPLVEETHADLMSSMSTVSQAPTRAIFSVRQTVKCVRPKCIDDLERPNRFYLVAFVLSFYGCYKLYYLLIEENCSAAFAAISSRICSSDLNDSQKDAVLSCLVTRECNHHNTVKLIWVPPGTGKTKTVGVLLFSLLRMKCKTLKCTPTNTAVLEVTQRLLKNVTESLEYDTYGLGDVVLFGNGKQMKILDRI